MNVQIKIVEQGKILLRLCLLLTMLLGYSATTIAQLNLSVDCNSGTANLSAITAANQPANTSLTWHSAHPVSNANTINDVSALAQGTYYVAFYDATTDCYSTEVTTITVGAACCLDNVCPATTVNLTTALSASNTPAGASLSYHTALPVSNGNTVTDPTSVGAGTYYITFYDATTGCYAENGTAATEVVVNSVTSCGTDNDGDGYSTEGLGLGLDPDDMNPCIPDDSNCLTNNCPITTVDLMAGFTANNQPAGTTISWHTGPSATDINKISDATMLGAGTYYAAFNDATSNCYSDNTTAVVVEIVSCTDTDGDGIIGAADTAPSDPCLPAQSAGYTGYVAGNATWAAADCDSDTYTNGTEDTAGSDPYDAASIPSTGDIVITEITICNQQIELYNASNGTIDVSNWYFCKAPIYESLGGGGNVSVVSGNLMIPAGGYLVLQWTHMDISAGEIGLYSNNSGFGSPANIKDYIQYNVANGTRASVAVSAGVWDDAANFISITTGASCPNVGVTNSPIVGTETNSTNWCDMPTSLGSANAACIIVNTGQDSDEDGIPDAVDQDDDNDGILDTDEQQACSNQFDAGWFSNIPGGNFDQDGVWEDAPGGGPVYPGNDASIVASSTPFVFGTGLDTTSVGSRWDLTGVNETSYANAALANDYVEYSFTTSASGIFPNGYVIFERFGLAEWDVSNQYNIAIAVSSNGFANSSLLLENGIIDGIPSGTGYEYIAYTNLLAESQLLPSTTYTLRVYLYGAASAATVISYDDFQFGTCTLLDTDSDGTPDYLDTDSDGDGCPDAIEGGDGNVWADVDANYRLTAAVDNNAASATYGVPGSSNQTVGTAQDNTQQSAICDECTETTHPLFSDSDSDGISDSCDLDDDNDGILDTDEQQPCSNQFDAGWFSNIPGGNFDQDGVWEGAPVGGPVYPGNDASIVASSTSFVFGTGLNTTAFGSRWDLTGVNETSYANAALANDYVEYSFTTPTSGVFPNGYVIFERFGLAEWDESSQYNIAIAVSGNGFASSNLLLENGIIDGIPNGAGIGYEYITYTNLLTEYQLLPSTTYTFRVYLYGAANAATVISYDDFQFGTCTLLDTDSDGTPDHLDLDADNDGINDVIEAGGTDANGDGIADGVVGTMPTTNGIPATANTGLTPPDTDLDGQPDFQDLDSDNDTVSDLIEGGSGATDANDDGVADGPDADMDGIVDSADGDDVNFGDSGDTLPPNTDTTDNPDYTDPDSNNDGTPDIDAAGNGALDTDNDGDVDEPITDIDDDGIADNVDDNTAVFGGLGQPGTDTDTDGDGIPNITDLDDDNDGIRDVTENATASADGDTDGDGIPDHLDLDADNDGINDVIEANGTDTDGNGIADGVVGTTPTTNGIPATANTGLTPPDTDLDGQPDFQDLDSDNDTVSDLIEGGSGAADANDDGVADGPDSDGDGIVNTADSDDVNYGDSGDTTPLDTDSEGTPDYIDPDSDDPTDNTVGAADGTDDDIDGTNNASQDDNGDGLLDTSDADMDGITDVVDAYNTIFGGLGTPDAVVITSDLTPNFTAGSTTFTAGQARFIVLNINEQAGVATSGQIQFFVPNSAGFTYSFNATLTSVTVVGTEAVNNPDWTVSDTGAGLLFTSNNVIAGNGRSRVALEVTGVTSGAVANTTINISTSSGGEMDPTNNTSVLSQSIQY